MYFMKSRHGFTLIELLIVIAIILILISIALPNFLEAQARARLARVKGDLRSLITAVEAFRTERGVLLIDFWDDGTPESKERWIKKFGQVGRNPIYTYQFFEECYYPLTSPAKYIAQVPTDLFNKPKKQVGLSAGETGLGYIYFDNDPLFPKIYDYGIDRFSPGNALQIQSQTKPLQDGEYGMLSVGPDGFIGTNSSGDNRGMAYNPTNGTYSLGDMVSLSRGGS
jgi:prepilin-type N-terminal cleavage/methylation domain-containing protein